MEQMKDMHVELRRLEDVIDSIEKKLHNTAGLLELIRSGMERLNGQEDTYEMVSVGPTTSMRMEKFEYEFTKATGVRVIVGKGGMGPNTERACKEFGAIHCVFPAGCAVVAATEVERIAEHHWDELGMPETLWCCKVKEFGPLIVSIDAQGRNMFEENKVIFNQKKDAAAAEICKHVSFIK